MTGSVPHPTSIQASVQHAKKLAASFGRRVVQWQKKFGRNDLPWQNTQDPYRVWLSEIMLQQTQVVTVLDYYPRFLQKFPDVHRLAAASQDAVLAQWSGLGYYSRARNLHACAVQIVQVHGGEFPRTADLLQKLPGIGRSTAGAIAALCFGQNVAILDGNVKRVLTRILAFDQDLAQAVNERALWSLAADLLPKRDLKISMPRYTQGMMDLGATVCLPSNPRCEHCPVASDCSAHLNASIHAFPVKSRKLKRSTQSIWMLWARSPQGAIWLSRRPTPGVWAGLFCFDLFDRREALEAAVPVRYRKLLKDQPMQIHALTHKDLHLHPVQVDLPLNVLQHPQGQWWLPAQWPQLGLPAPVRKMLAQSS